MQSQQLGELQLAIMRVLWERGEATAAEIHEGLREERPLAFTTITTMLTKLEAKGTVAHRSEGRRFIYRSLITEEEVQRVMVGDLTRKLFRGDVGALVSHLISEHEIDNSELARLKALIAAQEEDGEDGDRAKED